MTGFMLLKNDTEFLLRVSYILVLPVHLIVLSLL